MGKNTRRTIVIIVSSIGILLLVGFLLKDTVIRQFLKPTSSSLDQGIVANDFTPNSADITIVAESLQVPWGIAELPDGDLLVTERPGTVVRISDGQRLTIDGVQAEGEGGLLGIALHPDFVNNNYVYIYATTENGDGLTNRVERYVFRDNQLTKDRDIITNIPGARVHDGGQIAFAPDGTLYIGTGDAGDEQLAQDLSSLAGKILRLNDDGSLPLDNPYPGSAVYSYGHRNVQGLAWDDNGQLWATEHGPSGSASGNDELNKITAGSNYGWPIIRGQESRDGMIQPVAESGTEETWAPGGIAYAGGSLFFTGLRGATLYEAKLDPDRENVTEIIRHFSEDYGRLRAVIAVDNQRSLIISTSNTDGRGSPQPNDDRLLRITQKVFN